MQPAALPPEAREALLDGLRERAPSPEPLSAPPADPKAESTALHRDALRSFAPCSRSGCWCWC